MKIRFFALVPFIVLCIVMVSHGQPSVSEVRVTPQGGIAEIVISVHNYDVIIDSSGSIIRVESVVDKNLAPSITFQRETIKQKNGRNCELPNGRVSSIHDIQFLYAHSNAGRLERIGDFKLQYLGKDGRISHIGCVEVKYESSNKLESIGQVRFYYDSKNDRMLEATIIERSICSARVRVLTPTQLAK